MIFNEEKKRYECDLQHKCRKAPLIIGEYSCPEFESINRWQIDEKIDGTNVRVFWEPKVPSSPEFGGRTDNAQMPVPLVNHLNQVFPRDKLERHFPDVTRAVFFGEGYGPKIQACGGRYRKDVSFILFDVWIDGWWLEKHNVIEIAQQLDIEHTINQNVLCTMDVIDFVKSHPHSYIAEDPTLVMEGVIARSYPLMMFRQRHYPIMFKLKCSDFDNPI